jgi:nitronate monooxygenase
MNPTRRLLDLFGIALPIVQAPMAGCDTVALAAAVATADGLGSLACAMRSADDVRAAVAAFRTNGDRPLNLNFFCHREPAPDAAAQDAWRNALAPYYAEHGLDANAATQGASRRPFDEATCELVEALRPRVVSFHFGLPAPELVARVRAAGCVVIASATTVAEARHLEAHGCDAVIAMGAEAGGHRGMFLDGDASRQVGTFALVPQIVDAVGVPVIAAGGIADARGVAAAFALGAAAVQVGTAYLPCAEANVSAVHRAALAVANADDTAITNVFTGRPARSIANRAVRELGPMSPLAPAFPLAAAALLPLRQHAERAGSGDFSPLWAGQGVALARATDAAALTRALAQGVPGR